MLRLSYIRRSKKTNLKVHILDFWWIKAAISPPGNPLLWHLGWHRALAQFACIVGVQQQSARLVRSGQIELEHKAGRAAAYGEPIDTRHQHSRVSHGGKSSYTFEVARMSSEAVV